MSEINGISYIGKRNTYNTNSVKMSSGSSDFSSYLGETKSMDEIFREAADKYNLPVELLKAIGKAESGFNANAVSRCGAQGVMQLMPATAKELGVSDSFDAEQNIMGGAKYIASLLKKYDGDARLALAAYNAGSGNVAKYNGIPPFTETQNYVKKVMGYYGQGIEITSTVSSSNTIMASGRLATASMTSPVQRNTAFILTGNSNNIASGINDLDLLFSYEDYMRFIELLIEEKKEDQTEQNRTRNNNAEENNTNYSAGEISYNASVMNLLKNQNLI